ncbi:predicted protein [Uncinocarpus reesii 1704]|uniref:RGS domain-containing protein n=1 Tax=Uncinocarpus reesii (strain UAMH 1704) TaxID=336963 RepID=C4JJW8_UNCRE|nr:uncharacterized protein UREG_01925 [Uncinocarpus reesii 1704]EEP77076.1 predicted protein [Uncinocarpus reesii 1704]
MRPPPTTQYCNIIGPAQGKTDVIGLAQNSPLDFGWGAGLALESNYQLSKFKVGGQSLGLFDPLAVIVETLFSPFAKSGLREYMGLPAALDEAAYSSFVRRPASIPALPAATCLPLYHPACDSASSGPNRNPRKSNKQAAAQQTWGSLDRRSPSGTPFLSVLPPSESTFVSSTSPTVESSYGIVRAHGVEGTRRVWREIRARSRDAGSKRESLRGMISGRPRRSWDHTPESSPHHSPLPSDSDSDHEERMESWGPSRPLSIAVPGTQLARPTLEDVLADRSPPPYTLSAFTAYLSQNHCLETLEFIKAADLYRTYYHRPERNDTPEGHAQRLRFHWNRIINTYIVPGAAREINISSTVRDALLSHSQSSRPPHPDVLQAAVRRMRDLMDESIFLVFLNSRSPTQQPPPRVSYQYPQNIAMEETRINRHASIRRQISPEASYAVPRSSGFSSQPTSASNTSSLSSSAYRSSPHGYTSGDSVSGSLTDDSSSVPSSPGTGAPMTPPTTPPGSNMHSPRSRSDKGWKKMGMKLGWKK